MLKNTFLLIVLIFVLNSCTKELKKQEDAYLLTISIENNDGNKVYSQKISNLESIDSATITNGVAVFTGKIENPERHLITIENVFGGKMIILENDSINVIVKNNDLMNAQITGSKLNKELIEVQKKSEKIYNQIDFLFPDLQRARLENDAEKLLEISTKMKLITQENSNFHFNYAKENSNSFIAAMILNDLSKRDSIDIERISKIYNSLSNKVKKSVDAQKVAAFLKASH